MSRWTLRTSAAFDTDIRKLDKAVVRRIKKYLDDVLELEDPRSRGKGLTANRAGYWRYRIGDYRVIVQVQDDQFVLIAIAAAHRSNVYDG